MPSRLLRHAKPRLTLWRIISVRLQLLVNDEVTILSFRLEYPLQVYQVIRNGEIVRDAAGNELGYVAGRQNGLTELFIKEAA